MNASPPSVNTLLAAIKSTVELLVQFRGDSLTTKYGAVERLRQAVLAILSHGLQQNATDLYEQLWQFIVRLNANSQRHIHLLQEIYHKDNIRLSVEQWVDQSVISQCLAQQLACATNDAELLPQYYSSHAFMRTPPFYRAFLLCLRAVEESDPTLLIDIDPKLSITGYNPAVSITSLPDPVKALPTPPAKVFSPVIIGHEETKDDIQQSLPRLVHQRILHRRIRSDPVFSIPKDAANFNRARVTSPPPTPLHADSKTIPTISYFQTDECGSYGSSYGSRGDVYEQNKETKLTLGHPTAFSANRLSVSSEVTIIDDKDDIQRSSPIPPHDESALSTSSVSPMEQSFMTTTSDQPARASRLPHSSLFWPRKGQTLDNYIRECDLKTRTDVEKENAHFYFSEAIISAIEQIKFTQQCDKYFGQPWPSSTLSSMCSPCETMHASSSNSSSSPPTQQYIPCNTRLLSSNGSKSSIMETSQCEPTSEITESTEAPNNFDWSVRTATMSSSLQESSAESIALSLMETWKNYKVPTAPELFWMIPHDEDLPQQLLPLPNDISIDPSEDYISNGDGQRILCRGNSQWAPPREQLIFHIHQPASRENQLRKQSYLCAGCGRHVEKGFAHRYRYCEYTGKYFCRSCHSDKRSFLPSYIITKWDFSNKHSVSNFAYDYLNRIYAEPSFNLHDLNPKLFEKSKPLRCVDELRWSLRYLHHYIVTCRFAEEKGCQKMLQKLSSYVYADPQMYSIQDLHKTKSGDLVKVLEPIVVNLREHVYGCALCQAKGFICEICMNEKDIIFSFEFETTSLCPVCQSCFHLHCRESRKFQCPKCQRNKTRSGHASSNRTRAPANLS